MFIKIRLFVLWTTLMAASAGSTVEAGDWPQWRGPNRDNKSTETGLLKKWPVDGPPLRWRVSGIGAGISPVSIAGGRIYTVGYVDDAEFAICLDQLSGEKLWANRIGGAVRESPTMRWLAQRSPTVDSDHVYIIRADGDIVCLSTTDGSEQWRKNYVTDFTVKPPLYGFCDYPLVDGDQLVCVPGGEQNTVVALNRRDGETVWQTSLPNVTKAPYVPIIAAEFGGVQQYVVTTEGGLYGVAASEGRRLWSYGGLRLHNGVCQTPVVMGNRLFCAGAIDGGMALLKIEQNDDQFVVHEQYRKNLSLQRYQDNSIVVGGSAFLYRTFNVPMCVAVATGKVLREPTRRFSHGRSAVTYADGLMYVRGVDGSMNLVEVTPDRYEIASSFFIPDYSQSNGVTNPVVTGGSLYIRDNNRLFAYELRRDMPATKSGDVTLQLRDKSASATHTPSNRSVFVPTPHDVARRMLILADVSKEDLVVDLGSGDGRIVIAAARHFRCRAIGYEINPELVQLSQRASEAARVQNLVSFKQADLFSADLKQADVITLYLLPDQLQRLLPKLRQLKPGVRIVSHYCEIPGVAPDATVRITSEQDGQEHKLHLWTTPLASHKHEISE